MFSCGWSKILFHRKSYYLGRYPRLNKIVTRVKANAKRKNGKHNIVPRKFYGH